MSSARSSTSSVAEPWHCDEARDPIGSECGRVGPRSGHCSHSERVTGSEWKCVLLKFLLRIEHDN